jgi:hypothetical protein
MRSCDFKVADNLIKICMGLNQQISSTATFAVSQGGRRPKIIDAKETVEFICAQFKIVVDSDDSCCCSFKGNTLQIEIPIASVRIKGEVQERKLDFVAFSSVTFIPSPDSVSDDKFLLLELVKIPEKTSHS